eukprot:m.106902 g.106902  ORF g.106902 m.106902 type:complete len:58 (-) comp12683_c1_seq6:2354-2527(-)
MDQLCSHTHPFCFSSVVVFYSQPKGKMVGQPFKATAPSKSSYTKSISTMNAVRSTHK